MYQQNSIRTLLMVLCGFVGTAAVGSASAATDVVVRYRPATLDTEAGTKALYRRLVSAAEDACPRPAGTRFVTAGVKDCRDRALARAVEQVGSPALAALHAGATKRG